MPFSAARSPARAVEPSSSRPPRLPPPAPPPRAAEAEVADGTAEWAAELDRWLAPFLDLLGDTRRRPWLPRYVRGLLSPSERKSLTPLATHLARQDATAAETRYHHLQQFITQSTWAIAPLERLLIQRADALLGGPDAVLIVDDTALEQGPHSVGVAHQYCGEVGKLANCQCLVSLTLAQDEIPIPLVLRLYLPEEWTSDPERCAAVGVPAERQRPQTKIQLALEELTGLLALGVRFGLVTADAAYGTSAEFRHWLTTHRLLYAVGVQSHARVYPIDATIVYPPRPTRARQPGSRLGTEPYSVGRLRVRPVASEPSHPVGELLQGASWRTVTWREGSKGPLRGRWAAVRVRVADGEPGRRGEHMPGEIVWLVGEQLPDGRRRYYFTNHPARWSLRRLVRAIRSRWACEQAHLQLKQELGLDHFEGRSWRGLEHHTCLTLLAFAFLQHLRLQQQRQPPRGRRGEKPASLSRWPTLPAVRRALIVRLCSVTLSCPHCRRPLTYHPWE